MGLYFCVMIQEEAGEIRVVATEDGSKTLYLRGMDETYHSTHGAITESHHVYIANGLDFWLTEHPDAGEVRVFEMGLGTGTNALLVMDWCERTGCSVLYYTVEKFPLLETLMRDYWGDAGYAERSEALRTRCGTIAAVSMVTSSPAEIPDTFNMVCDYPGGPTVICISSMANDTPIPHVIRGHEGTRAQNRAGTRPDSHAACCPENKKGRQRLATCSCRFSWLRGHAAVITD